MAPFGRCLGKYLYAREMTQAMLADQLEMKVSYLSMILNSYYLTQPKDSFVKKVIKALDLNEVEAEELVLSAELSRRVIIIPAKAPAKSFEIAHEVLACIKNNETKKLERILAILKDV